MVKLIIISREHKMVKIHSQCFVIIHYNFDLLCSCVTNMQNYKEQKHSFLSLDLVPKLHSRSLEV